MDFNSKKVVIYFFQLVSLYIVLIEKSVYAQIVPDITLINNSKVTTSNSSNIINGGTRAGVNLFHSFKEFSVSTGSEAFFNNTVDIQNIISRVTGGSVSNIDGLIQTNGKANLFLLNPSGIIFGQNARLDIGGSFLASTANAIKFPNNLEFNAVNPQSSVLLSINLPIGLQFGQSPGAIQVLGDGRGVRTTSTLIDTDKALRVKSDQTLALVGGDISLEGATLKTAGGRIELGSVSGESFVEINPIIKGFALGYETAQELGRIQLSRQASVDSSGEGSGDIQIQAQQIKIEGGSQVESGLLRQSNSTGIIKISATESIQITGTSPIQPRLRSAIGSTIYPEAKGTGARLRLDTRNLVVEKGAQVGSFAFSAGVPGDVIINASDSLQVNGTSSLDPRVFSNLSIISSSEDRGGNITLSTRNLTIKDGAVVGIANLGNGGVGNARINASLIKVTGVSPLFSPSSLSNTAIANGNAGALYINTGKLLITNGGAVNTSTVGTGNAGNIFINASDSITVSGRATTPRLSVRSSLSSSAVIPIIPIQQTLNIPISILGNSGEININTNSLNVVDGGLVSINNEGSGNAERLNINSKFILLNNESEVTASTKLGNGGNIYINTGISLLTNNSKFSAIAGGQGNGGNITINADVIAGFNNSRITADAFEGRGGNILINTQGLFFSKDSQVTANSFRGINGTVETNVSRTQSELVNAQLELPKSTPEIASVCPGKAGAVAGKFVNRGRESAPVNFDNILYNQVFLENDSVAVGEDESIAKKPTPAIEQTKQIVPAQGWVFDSKGQVTLVATNPNEVTPDSLLNANSCSSVTPISQLFPSIEASNSNE